MPRKTRLALEAVLDIAYNHRAQPVQLRDITQRQGVPHRSLEPLLQRLVRAGVLKGVRGPRGGYTLARGHEQVTLGEVLRALGAADPEGTGPEAGAEFGQKVLVPLFDDIRAGVLARLDRITIEDLCREAAARGVPRAGAARAAANL